MRRHLRMGAWTGLLAGIATTVTVLVADLAAGGGLDGTERVSTLLGLAAGVLGPLLVLVVGIPLVVVLLGLVLALLPVRVSGAASGLGLGLLVGVGLAGALDSGSAGPSLTTAVSTALAGAWAGLLTGFLYSRYTRTLRRSPSERPFGPR